MSDQIIYLSPDEINALQAALDEPMTIEDARDVLSEFGFLIQPPLMQGATIYWEVSTGRTVECATDADVIALAQEELEKELV